MGLVGQHDPLCDAYEDDFRDPQQEQEENEILDYHGVYIQIPVLTKRINRVFLDLAARVQGKRTDDFVKDALNEEATGDFEDELAKFLRGDEDQEAENADQQADEGNPF